MGSADHPAAGGCTLIVNRATGQSAVSHYAGADLVRVAMTTSESSTVTERLTISVDPAASGGILRIAWDRTEARIPIAVPG